jgi:hypothetical protein
VTGEAATKEMVSEAAKLMKMVESCIFADDSYECEGIVDKRREARF